MASPTVHQSPNGTKPLNGHRPAGRVVPLLGPQIDHLLELRTLIRRAQAEERTMTAEVLGAMEAVGVERLVGGQAVAIREERRTLRPDPERFVQTAGERAWAAVSVSVTVARRVLAENDLAAISETTISPALRIEPLAPTAAA